MTIEQRAEALSHELFALRHTNGATVQHGIDVIHRELRAVVEACAEVGQRVAAEEPNIHMRPQRIAEQIRREVGQ